MNMIEDSCVRFILCYCISYHIISYFSTTTTTINRCRILCWQSKVFPALGLGHDQKLARLDTWADFLHDHLQQIVQYICDSTVMNWESSLHTRSALVCYVYIHHDAHDSASQLCCPLDCVSQGPDIFPNVSGICGYWL